MLEAEYLIFCRRVEINESGISLIGTSDIIPTTGFPIAVTDQITAVSKIRVKKALAGKDIPYRLEVEYENTLVWNCFFLHPKLKTGLPMLRARQSFLGSNADRTAGNMEDIAVANFELQKEALQKNLTLVHRSVMVALFAALVAVILGIVAIRTKTPVTVKVEVPSTSVKH